MVTTLSFQDKLRIASKKNRSLLCVGLDPEPSLVPKESVLAFNRLIIAATARLACAYKPNLALYEAMGTAGLQVLADTLEEIRLTDPDIPIIGDAKRGDIGNCSLAYVATLFDGYGFDAVTVNPYMGFDSLEPFLERKDKGIFVLCRTSNPGGKDLQDLMVVGGGESDPRPLYEVVAHLTKTWNKHGNVGLVLGATCPEEIGRVRHICPDMDFLIPGIGPQGGDLRGAVSNAINAKGSGFIINVSRQVMYGAKDTTGHLRTKKEAVKGIARVARALRDRINEYRSLYTLPDPQSDRTNPEMVGSVAR